MSLIIELASIYLTRRAIRIVKKDIKEKSPSAPPEVGSTIEEELNRRTSSLSHYLYRGPLFEIVMERILKSILLPIFKRIPLIGASFGKLSYFNSKFNINTTFSSWLYRVYYHDSTILLLLQSFCLINMLFISGIKCYSKIHHYGYDEWFHPKPHLHPQP